MPIIPALTTFTASTLAKAAEVNSNNTTIRTTLNTYGLFTDVDRTVTATLTFSTSPVLPGNITVGGTLTSTGAFVASTGATVTAGGLTVTAGGVTVTLGGLTVVAGGVTVTGNSTITGDLVVTGSVTAATIIGTPSIAASAVTAGTFPASASWRFGAGGGKSLKIDTTAGLVVAERMRLAGGVQDDSTINTNRTVDVVTYHQFTVIGGPITITPNGGQPGISYCLLRQDGVGGHTVTFAGVTAWDGGSAPTVSTTANAAMIVRFYVSAGGLVIGSVVAEGFTLSGAM